MNIRITYISLTNFKCFRSKELAFDGEITTIRGRNGAGKTTIADAILFCLFGKNTMGQSDLELFKTRENGKVIPNLDHSVELSLSVEDRDITLKRSIKEVWIKKRGSDESVFKNNTVEYFVNGESFTKKDYEQFISNLISEDVFRAITNPNYFPSLKWQDQRAFLSQLDGEIQTEEIANTKELAEFIQYLNPSESVVEYLKHLSYQIKQIKDKLEKIPVRLEEQNKALPEKLNWDGLQMELDEAKKRLKETEETILKVNSGNGADVKRKELRNQISETTMAVDKLTFDARTKASYKKSEKQKRLNEASIKFNEALNNQKLMEQTIEADKRMIERCKETIDDCDKQLQKLREEWPTQKFEIEQNVGYCPTCGQSLPPDVVEGKIEHLRQQFNQNKEAKKKELNERAAKIKQEKLDADTEREAKEQKLVDDTKQLEVIKESINTIFSEKAKIEKEPIKSVDEILAENEQYVALSKQLEELKAALESITGTEIDKEQLEELKKKRDEEDEDVSRLQALLSTRQQYDKIVSLIGGINKEQEDLVKQLSELERKEDIARQYQFRQNQLLEERINKHFKLVQWRLFKTINNGGDSFEEPFCECYVDGVGYHSGLNQAARLNAGLDIVNALCNFYSVSAPIILDNAESTLNILQTAGQQLRLQVFDSELNLV